MKCLKNFMIFLSCIMLSPSVNAGIFDKPVDSAEILGRAVCSAFRVSSDPALEGSREDYEEFERHYTLYKEAVFENLRTGAGYIRSPAILSDIQQRIGLRYIEDPSPFLRVLQKIIQEKSDLKEVWPVAYYRAHLLLDGIGVEEEEKGAAKAAAFTLIERLLEQDSENDPVLKLLFQHFLPDNPLALEHFRKLEEKVNRKDALATEQFDHLYFKHRPLHSNVQLLEFAHKVMEQRNVSDIKSSQDGEL